MLTGCDRLAASLGLEGKMLTKGSLMSFHPHFNYPNKLPEEALFVRRNPGSSDKPGRHLSAWQLRCIRRESSLPPGGRHTMARPAAASCHLEPEGPLLKSTSLLSDAHSLVSAIPATTMLRNKHKTSVHTIIICNHYLQSRYS